MPPAPTINCDARASSTSVTVESCVAPWITTVSSTGAPPKLMAVTSRSAVSGNLCTNTNNPFACTAGASTNRPAYRRKSARTFNIRANREANESGLLSCFGSGPYSATVTGKPAADVFAFVFEPIKSYAPRLIHRVSPSASRSFTTAPGRVSAPTRSHPDSAITPG